MPGQLGSSAKSPFSERCETSEELNSENIVIIIVNKVQKTKKNMGGDDNKNAGNTNFNCCVDIETFFRRHKTRLLLK